jgi:exopolysaccharide biosynthesis polyprenyl glycosylphosphotransferase
VGTDEPGGTIPAGPPDDAGLSSPSSPKRDATARSPRARGAIRLRPRGRSGSPARRWVRGTLVLADMGAMLLAMTTAGSWSAAAWMYGGAVLISLGVSGAYQPRICLQALPELPRLVGRLAVPTLLLMPFGLIGLEQAIFLQVPFVVAALCAARTLAYAGLRLGRRTGHLKEPTLIVGAGTVAVELARLMKQHPEYGLEPLGFVDSPAENGRLPLPHLGPIGELELILRRFDVHRVVVAFGQVREADWVSVMRTAVVNGVEIHVVPRFFDIGMASTGTGTDQIWGIPLCRVRRSVLHSAAWRTKRILDLTCASLLLLVSAPFLALIALAVRCSSPGPILYCQRRIGQHGREFDLIKFRSMCTHHNGAISWEATEAHQTAVGRWLRRTSLDELPQLWNVVRGDMSLVGPRPERPQFVARFMTDIPGYGDRHRFPVGLTGWAQIHGLRGNETSLTERVRFDNLYIEGWSPWLDIVTLLRTVGAVVRMALKPLPFHGRVGRRLAHSLGRPLEATGYRGKPSRRHHQDGHLIGHSPARPHS